MSRSPFPYLTSTAASLLSSLQSTHATNTSYVTGMLALPESAFTIHYKDGSHAACTTVNPLSASAAELDAFIAASEPSAVRRQGKRVIDESFRKSSRLCASSFSIPIVPERTELRDIIRDLLLEGKDCTREIGLELYELEIYGQGSFFKSHRRAQHNDGVFGSLLLTFPTSHTGGELVLHPNEGEKHVFDTGAKLSMRSSDMGYAAFLGDVKHEVLPVTEGHRITLQYNLSWVSKQTIPSSSSSAHQMMEWTAILERFLTDSSVLPEGGLFCFGLRNTYPVPPETKMDLNAFPPADMDEVLKGTDSLLFRALKRLGLQPVIKLSYNGCYNPKSRRHKDDPTLGLVCHPLKLEELSYSWESRSLNGLVRKEGLLARQGLDANQVIWITPVTAASRILQTYAKSEEKFASVVRVYADLCIVARVKSGDQRTGKSSKRLRLVEDAPEESDDSEDDSNEPLAKKRRC